MVRLNVAFLRRGLAVGSQHLLSVRGRKSGIVRATPVSLVTLDGNRYLVAAFAEADWVKNVRAAGAGALSRGRDQETVGLVELPESERDAVLRAFLSQVRGGRRFFDSADPEAIVASAGRYPVFRVVPTR
jgi:deazaflavin-dependent oxidoreductase (nitroreductase family)